jgi:predicted ATPase
MKVNRLRIRNFKSLGDVVFYPDKFSVIIGPNNAGKTNFANALRFLSEVYSFGLETAVRRNGGYENIALRRKRRSRSAIVFESSIKVENLENLQSNILEGIGDTFFIKPSSETSFYIDHSFSFKATRQNIKAEYVVEREFFEIYYYKKISSGKTKKATLFSFRRDGQGSPSFNVNKNEIGETIGGRFLKSNFDQLLKGGGVLTSKQGLIITNPIFRMFSPIERIIENWAIYQLRPSATRLEGVPTPQPELNQYGENLPALVDWLLNHHKDKWDLVLNTIRVIIPDIEDINTGYLRSKTLGIFFYEKGYGRPWTIEEVSDGTVLTLAMLCASIDPRKTLIFLEELENSIHPWIIKILVDFFKEVAEEKNVILTTHSPVLIDLVYPKDIWVISRSYGITSLKRLVDLDPEITAGWERGDFKISQYLDSGLIPNTNP